MRAERERLLALVEDERAAWHAHMRAIGEAHAAERASWAEERKLLLNAVMSRNTGDFLARQQATKPKGPQPIAAVPDEAMKGRPRAMGI